MAEISNASSRLFLERAVRPYQIYDVTPEAPAKPKRLLPGHDTEAYIEWGTTSNFSSSSDNEDPVDSKKQGGTTGFEVVPEEDEEFDNTFTESSRDTEEIRVENPDDPDAYVMVERITMITFSQKKGKEIKFKFANN